MSLQLIYGKAGSGKTEYILNEVKDRINLGQKIYVIVPEQFSYAAEKKLLKTLEETSCINAEVISFNLIARRMLTEIGRKSKNFFIKKRKGYVNI